MSHYQMLSDEELIEEAKYLPTGTDLMELVKELANRLEDVLTIEED